MIKIGNTTFNQVDPNQAQEWLNGTGKKGGGIVDITKTSLPWQDGHYHSICGHT